MQISSEGFILYPALGDKVELPILRAEGLFVHPVDWHSL